MENNSIDIFDTSSLLNIGLSEGAGMTVEDDIEDTVLYESAIFNALSTDEISALLEDTNEMEYLKDQGFLSEKVQVIRISKEGQLKRLEGQAVLVAARKKNDRDFLKLVKVWKMRRFLLEKLKKKYGSIAKTEAKKMQKALGRSKSVVAKKVSKTIK